MVTPGFQNGNSAAAVNGCWQCHGSEVKVLPGGKLDAACRVALIESGRWVPEQFRWRAMSEQEKWASRVGLVLAMAGNAVGLGNFLRFPGQVKRGAIGAAQQSIGVVE